MEIRWLGEVELTFNPSFYPSTISAAEAKMLSVDRTAVFQAKKVLAAAEPEDVTAVERLALLRKRSNIVAELL